MSLHNSSWSTSVLEINSEGALLLNGSPESISSMGILLFDNLSVSIDGNDCIVVPFVEHELLAGLWDVYLCSSIKGRNGLFLVLYNGNLADATGAHVGSEVVITAYENQKCKFDYLPPLQLSCKDNRFDAQSELEYANFRMIASRNIKRGVLYRGCSLWNYSLSLERCCTTNRLCMENKVCSIVDLVDTSSGIECYINDYSESKDSYAAQLYFTNNVYAGFFPRNIFSVEAREQLLHIFHFFNSHKPPFFIHCNSGLYRTGFLCLLIEGLMGADPQELIYDYMTSYVNFYRLKRTSDLYQLLANFSPLRYLYIFSHLDCINHQLNVKWEHDLTNYRTLDISQGIEKYLLDYVHLSKQNIEEFKCKIAK